MWVPQAQLKCLYLASHFLSPKVAVFVVGGRVKLPLDLVCFSVAVKQPNNLPWFPPPPKIKPDQKKGCLEYPAQEPSYLNLPRSPWGSELCVSGFFWCWGWMTFRVCHTLCEQFYPQPPPPFQSFCFWAFLVVQSMNFWFFASTSWILGLQTCTMCCWRWNQGFLAHYLSVLSFEPPQPSTFIPQLVFACCIFCRSSAFLLIVLYTVMSSPGPTPCLWYFKPRWGISVFPYVILDVSVMSFKNSSVVC